MLPPRLDQLISSLQDAPLAAKLRDVFDAADRAIGRLSDMDLVKYEPEASEDSADLSLWEAMAPVIRDTVVDVNALLAAIRKAFPPDVPGGISETLSRTAEEAGAPRGKKVSSEAVANVFKEASAKLAQEVTALGEAMRSPDVVSDRWNLLARIQASRSRFREEIGELVYEASGKLGAYVERVEVIPGFEEALRTAVRVRATVADLHRLVKARLNRIRDAEGEDIPWHGRQLGKELDTFGRTGAYKALRAQDKRAILEFRNRLGEVAARSDVSREDLLLVVGPFVPRVEAIRKVTNAPMLREHDGEALARCGVLCEQAEAGGGEAGADPAQVAEAFRVAQALYGKSDELDKLIRKVRKEPIESRPPEGVRAALDELRSLLSDLPLIDHGGA